MPAGEGDGLATVKLSNAEQTAAKSLVERTMSNPTTNPTTGADLGAGPGAGRTTDEDMGQAPDIQHADKTKVK
jgi:Mn-containing catalase